MIVNSYAYYQYEVALARLLQKMIDRSKEIEKFKKTYIKHMKFDSNQIFSSMDIDKKSALKKEEIMAFLRLNSIKADEKEAEFIIMCYTNQRRSLLFKDFLKIILPQGEPDFMDQVLKQTLSNVKATDMRMSPFIEHEISILFDMELKFNRDIEKEKISIAQKYNWSYKLALDVFTKGSLQHITQKHMMQFMDCNGDGRYEFEDYKYIINRYKKNDSMEEGILDIRDFGDLIYPYHFFYDPNLAMYENYKSREDEIEKEQLVVRKNIQRQEFDDKFKIIGNFIKDPEYYEQFPPLIEFFETHKFKEIYKTLKDFDQYVEYAKKNIVHKKKEEEEKKMVLDYNDIIKQNTQAEAPKKKDPSVWEDGTKKYVPVPDIIQDISGMPHLKDYLKQMEYTLPDPPKTLAEKLQKIRSDRNLFYYDRDDIKLHQRMELFTDIREEQLKQEKRQMEINAELGKIKDEEKYQEEKQTRKLFSAYSSYSIAEGESPPKKNQLDKSSLNNSMFANQFDDFNGKKFYDQIDSFERKSNVPKETGGGLSHLNSMMMGLGAAGEKADVVHQRGSIFSRRSADDQQQDYFKGAGSTAAALALGAGIKIDEIENDEGEDERGEQHEESKMIRSTQPPPQYEARVDTDESFEDAFRSFQENYDLAEKYTQEKQKRGVIQNANKTIQGFKLIQAAKRSKMVQNILDRSRIGDYSNAAVYKKFK